MSATPVVTAPTVEVPATTAAAPPAPVKAKRKTGGGRKKKAAAAEADAKVAPAVTITPPVTAAPAAPAAKPKPRINAHSLWAAGRKPELRALYPNEKPREIATRLSAEWKELDGDRRAEFEKRAAEQKRQREAEEKAAVAAAAQAAAEAARLAAEAAAAAAAPSGKKKGGKKRKAECADGTTKPKVSNGIKRSMSAYMFFTQDYKKKKAENGGVAPIVAKVAPVATDGVAVDAKEGEQKLNQSGHRMGDLWRGLSADEKKPYEAKAAADKERYRREKAEYDLAHPKPPKVQTRPYTAYIIFTKDKRPGMKAEHPGLKFKETGVKLGEDWRKIKDDKEARRPYDEERQRQIAHFKALNEAKTAAAAAAAVPVAVAVA